MRNNQARKLTEKIVFFHNKAAHVDIQLIEECTGIPGDNFPLTDLGCPIGHVRKKKTFCRIDEKGTK